MKKTLNISIFIATGILTFVFKTDARKSLANNVFQLSTGGNENNPLDYSPSAWGSCIGTGNICKIDVLSSDVFTAVEAAAAGNPAWVGHPKVLLGSLLATQIIIAKSASADPVVITSRIYEKRL